MDKVVLQVTVFKQLPDRSFCSIAPLKVHSSCRQVILCADLVIDGSRQCGYGGISNPAWPVQALARLGDVDAPVVCHISRVVGPLAHGSCSEALAVPAHSPTQGRSVGSVGGM